MRLSNMPFLATFLLVALMIVQVVQGETWSDSTGKYTIEAKFLDVRGGILYLEGADGNTIKVPIKRLSPKSLEQAKRLYHQKMAGNEGAEPKALALPPVAEARLASKLPANPTAKQTYEIMRRAAVEVDLVTLWDGLPRKHQRDFESVVQQAANSIDDQTWNDAISLLQKVSKLVREKKASFRDLPITMNSGRLVHRTRVWDAIADLLDAIADSSLADQKAMKQFNMDKFIANDFAKIQEPLSRLRGLTDILERFAFPWRLTKELEYVKQTETGVLLRSQEDWRFCFRCGPPAPTNEQPEQHDQHFVHFQLVKVDNRWLPKFYMVDAWNKNLEQTRGEIAKLSTPKGQASARKSMMDLNASIDKLLAADRNSFHHQMYTFIYLENPDFYGRLEVSPSFMRMLFETYWPFWASMARWVIKGF